MGHSERGREIMSKFIITITEILGKDPLSTAVVNISDGTIAVSRSTDSGIEIESGYRASGYELIFKLPRADQTLHFICADCHTTHNGDTVELVETLGVSNKFPVLAESYYSLQ